MMRRSSTENREPAWMPEWTPLEPNVHEPECDATRGMVHDGMTPAWTIEIEYSPGRPIVAHAMNRVTGDQICYVDATEESPSNSPLGELFARVRDTFDQA